MADIKLRPLQVEDTANIVKWRNRDFVRKNLYTQGLLTEEQHLSYFEKKIKTGQVRQFVIVADGMADIGTVFFKNIDEDNRKAELGIFIGEPQYLRGGYGTAALLESVKTAFESLGLNKIYATIIQGNIPSQKLFLRVGFTQSGLLLEDYLGKEGYKNILLMEITKTMWAISINNNRNHPIAGGGGQLIILFIICRHALLTRKRVRHECGIGFGCRCYSGATD